MKLKIEVGDIADYTWGEEHGDKAIQLAKLP